jgi:hypothetical protein
MNSKNLNAAAHSTMTELLSKEQQKKMPELVKTVKEVFKRGANWGHEQPANNLPKFENPPPPPPEKDNSERESKLWHMLAKLISVSPKFDVAAPDNLKFPFSYADYTKALSQAIEVLKGAPLPFEPTPISNQNNNTMHLDKISYEKCFPLGGYSNEKIGVSVTIAPGEDPLEAFAEAKKQVEKSHKFFRELPVYEQAQKVVADPMNHTGREVESSKQFIEMFEQNFPDYLAKFIPTSRQLTEGKEPEYQDED